MDLGGKTGVKAKFLEIGSVILAEILPFENKEISGLPPHSSSWCSAKDLSLLVFVPTALPEVTSAGAAINLRH